MKRILCLLAFFISANVFSAEYINFTEVYLSYKMDKQSQVPVITNEEIVADLNIRELTNKGRIVQHLIPVVIVLKGITSGDFFKKKKKATKKIEIRRLSGKKVGDIVKNFYIGKSLDIPFFNVHLMFAVNRDNILLDWPDVDNNPIGFSLFYLKIRPVDEEFNKFGGKILRKIAL